MLKVELPCRNKRGSLQRSFIDVLKEGIPRIGVTGAVATSDGRS